MEFDKAYILSQCNTLSRNTLMETLEIEYIDAGTDFLVARMPVNSRVHQPMGLLHGGATVALAESVGSAASMLQINPAMQEVRGIEISAHHLKSVRSGMVQATARLLHKGRSLHLWEIRVENEAGELVSLCKLSTMVLPKRQ